MEENKEVKTGKVIGIIVIVAAVLAIIGGVYWYIYSSSIDMQTIKPIDTQAKDVFEMNYTSHDDLMGNEKALNKLESLKSINYNHVQRAELLLGDAVWIDAVDKYTASSTLSDKYNVKNLYDNKYKTAWAEGKEGLGIGEYIGIQSQMCNYEQLGQYINVDDIINNPDAVSLQTIADAMKTYGQNSTTDGKDPVQYVTGVYIVNGYAENLELWQENARIKKLKVYSDNKEIAILELKDTDKAQLFDIPKITHPINQPLNLKFEILEVYPGTKYEDTYLSELVLNTDTNLLKGR